MTMTATEKTQRAYPDKKGTDRVREDCFKCGGSGYIPVYNHIENGVCFECDGAGGHMVLVSSIRARETRERKWAEKVAAIRAAKAAWMEANAALMTRLREVGQGDLVDWAQYEVEQPNEKTTAVLQARLLKAEAEVAKTALAEPVPVTSDRIKITGKILGLKEVPDPYSYTGGYNLKALVEDDRGFKVYGTATAAMFKGQRVEFMASVERSRDDEKFGFFKRPTKVVVLLDAEGNVPEVKAPVVSVKIDDTDIDW